MVMDMFTEQQFQSTFPRRERPSRDDHILFILPVSIHVPAKGTTSTIRRHGSDAGFQSTFPRRERRTEGAGYHPQAHVSIHVPTKGTTKLSSFVAMSQQCFNPRSREGNDEHRKDAVLFWNGFNPRSREGNDKQLKKSLLVTR